METKLTQTQVFGQAELFPLLVARLTWEKRLQGKRVIYFIDNESSRLGLVKAYSPVAASLDIINQVFQWDHVYDSMGWFARVPTASNIGDGSSRMSHKEVCFFQGARAVEPVFPVGDVPARILR